MITGLALYLVGTLTGIALSLLCLAVSRWGIEMRDQLALLSGYTQDITQHYDHLKTQITKEGSFICQRLTTIEKKVDELKPDEPPVPKTTDDIGNRSV